jgi:hypothetical protein
VGQVNKIVEIMGLEIYCSTFQGTMDFSVENDGNSKLLGNKAFEGKSHDFLLVPCDVSLSLLVCNLIHNHSAATNFPFLYCHLSLSCNFNFIRFFLWLSRLVV